jgi:hypothetical protein
MNKMLRRSVAILVIISFTTLTAGPVTVQAVQSPRPTAANRVSPLLERIAKEKQLTREEVDFIEAFATRLSHSLAVVAANPNKAFPAQSLAGRVRTAFLGLNAGQRTAAQQRAQTLLSKEVSERRLYFGAYAAAGADARHLSAAPILDAELKSKFRAAVDARMKVLRSGAGKLTEVLTTKPWVTIPKTWLEGGFLLEGDLQGKQQLTLNEPVIVNFRWRTLEAGAGQAYWQLLRALPGKPAIVLASGISDRRIGKEANGRFEIDFRKYLPPKPAEAPVYYYVRVLAQAKAPLTPSRRTGPQIQTKPKVAPKPESKGSGVSLPVTPEGIGSFSAPVIISYCALGKDAWGQNIQAGEMYKKLGFYLDSIEMVKDQDGPGDEEFHVAGFVKEILPTKSKLAEKRVKFGRYFALLEGEPGDSHKFGKEAWFDLQDLDESNWPRTYTAVFTIMEEDDGGSLSQWASEFWDIVETGTESEMFDMISEILQEYQDEFIKEGKEFVYAYVADIISGLVNPIVWLVATIVIVAVTVIIAIVCGMPDDFYGIEASVLVLPFNDTTYLESPKLRTQYRSGAFNANSGMYEFSERIRFLGQSSWPDPSAFDGIVDLRIKWMFSEKAIY